VERDKNVAKLWITPIRVQSTGGFRRSEINRILRVTEEKLEDLLRGWDEHCGN